MTIRIGIIVLIVFILASDRGLLYIIRRRKSHRYQYANIPLLMHIIHNENTKEEKIESSIYTIHNHLQWETEFLSKIISITKENKYITINEEGIIKLTKQGREYAKLRCFEYLNRGCSIKRNLIYI